MTDDERWTTADDIDSRFHAAVIGAGDAKPQGIVAAVLSDKPHPFSPGEEFCWCGRRSMNKIHRPAADGGTPQ